MSNDDPLSVCCRLLAESQAIIEAKNAEIELLRGYRDEAESQAAIASLAADRLRLANAEREADIKAREDEADQLRGDLSVLRLQRDSARDDAARLRETAVVISEAESDAIAEVAAFYGGIVDDDRCQQIASAMKCLLDRAGRPVSSFVAKKLDEK